MKTEKIEIWVNDPQRLIELLQEEEDITTDYWSCGKGEKYYKYKVTLEVEMPEREGNFTESQIKNCIHEIIRTQDKYTIDLDSNVDKLFNGDFKE